MELLESVGPRPRQARYQAALRPDAEILARPRPDSWSAVHRDRGLSAAISCSMALLVISLMFSFFILRSPVRSFGSFTQDRGTNRRAHRRTQRVQVSAAGAAGQRAGQVGFTWRGRVPAEAVWG